MPSGYNALAARPQNRLAYPGQDVVNAFTQGLGPMLYGAAKGTAAAVAGLPGDIEQLARQLLLSGAAPDSYTAKNMAAQALLPTSDRVKAMLPSLPGAGPQAQYSENMGATLGQNVVGNLVAPKALPAVTQMAGQGAAATGRFVAPKAGQLAEEYMVRTGGILPLDVYHGTPHTLPPTPNNPLGEFDASKIGTGEGAQAFGYGIYTAENPNVAKGYAEQLSQNRLFDSKGLPFDVQASLSNPNVRAVLNKTNGDIDAAIARARQSIESIPGTQGAEYAAKDIETLNAIKASGGLQKQSGNLYKVDLPDEKIAKMLDWDKPLSQQPANVQAALKGMASKFPEIDNFNLSKWMDADPLASTFHNVLQRDLGVDPATIANTFKEQGIPGIKYFDGGSRETGGTRNFVVFPGEEKSMTILERNGQPAPLSVADQIDNINEVLKKKRKK
jgi:hypothetical protein